MDLRRAAEVLIRARPTPLTTLLTPALSKSQTSSKSRCRMRQQPISRIQAPPNRAFATTAPSGADDSSSNPRFPSTSSSSSDDYEKQLDSLLDFATHRHTGAASPSRTSHFSSPSAQTEARSPLAAALSFTSPPLSSPSTTSSAEHFAALFARDVQLRSRTRSPRVDTSRMAMPARSSAAPPPPMIPETPPPMLRLGPSVGRTVQVDKNRGMDLARSIQVLEINCARNGVRRDFASQRFHERPGLRRKRLHSERWRKRFRVGFQAVVTKVDRMRRQGW